MKKLLVFIETENDSIADVSLEIVAHAANCMQNLELNAFLMTNDVCKDSLLNQLRNKGIDNLYISVDDKFKTFAAQAFTTTLSGFLKQHPQDIFLIGATSVGRELAPRIAARNDLGLTADCTEIDIDEDCTLLATRPTYGGQLMATIISKTVPNFATVRPGALKKQTTFFDKETNVISYNADLNNILEAVKVLKTEKKAVDTGLEQADLIIAGGLGLKTKENFDLLVRFAQLIGAKPAASRAAVELGWAEQDIQVGQTGHSVAPKLYIAFGISGAMQHLVGISNADKIIAVNNDKNAPIFEAADLGIVTDAPSLLKELVEKLDTEPTSIVK